jgi:hypothetical protein
VQQWNPEAPSSPVALNDHDRDCLDQLLHLVRRGYLGSNQVAQSVYAYHEDSVDGTYSATLKFWLPRGTVKVVEMGLRFALLPFRAYSKAAASGGGTTQTSGASSSSTTASGGSSTPTSGASSATTTASGGGDTSGTWGEFSGTGAANLANAGTGASGAATGDTASGTGYTSGTTGATGGHTHSYWEPAGHVHGLNSHTHTGPSHTHSDSGHVHFIPNHAHTNPTHTHGMAHTHDVTIGAHTHGMAHTHGVTIGAHTHSAVYGIYESTSATGVTVTVNGTDRTAVLGGGPGFTADQNWLDINQADWLSFGVADADCLNTIVLTSTQLGRIRAQVDGLVMRALRS